MVLVAGRWSLVAGNCERRNQHQHQQPATSTSTSTSNQHRPIALPKRRCAG